MSKSKKILGIDPGLARAGYGIVVSSNGNFSAKTYGCIETKKNENTEIRFKIIYDSITKIILKEKPDEMAIEKLYFAKNVTNALTVSHARGVIMLAAANNNIPIREFTPLQIKQALTGYGRAEKKQIQKVIKMILNLKEIPKPDDTADALAVAVCAHQTKDHSYEK
jgi:crossover junction endodeoxyribonuclease RuvC